MQRYNIRDAQMTDMEAVARVHIASWRTTYTGMIDDSVFDEMEINLDGRIDARHQQFGRHDVHTLVMTSPQGHIVGFADVGLAADGDASSENGELYSIYVLKGWQGLGGGRSLVRAGVAWLAGKHFKTMTVRVLQANASRAFYQHLGAEFVHERPITIGTKTFTEEAYRWSQLPV